MPIDPAPSPDGSLYFMSIEQQGFLMRAGPIRLPRRKRIWPSTTRSSPALPPPRVTPVALRDEPVTPRDYGIGRQEWRSLFGGQYTAFRHTTELGIRLGDVIGRLDTILTGAFGSRSMPRGLAVASAWRGFTVIAMLQSKRKRRYVPALRRGYRRGCCVPSPSRRKIWTATEACF
jgi:hypothetical protein